MKAEQQGKEHQTGSWFYFSIIKSLFKNLKIGSDLTKQTVPSALCYPSSVLEYLAIKRMRGMRVLESIDEETQCPLERFLLVLRWFFCCLTRHRYGKKPLNSVIGEVFLCEADGYAYLGEQVSHHPPVSAFHIEKLPDKDFPQVKEQEKEEHTSKSRGKNKQKEKEALIGRKDNTKKKLKAHAYETKERSQTLEGRSSISFDAHIEISSQFQGNSVIIKSLGNGRLCVGDDVFVFPSGFPSINARNIILGTFRNEYGGTTVIEFPSAGIRAELEFLVTGTFTGYHKRDIVVGTISTKVETAHRVFDIAAHSKKEYKQEGKKRRTSQKERKENAREGTTEWVPIADIEGKWSGTVTYTVREEYYDWLPVSSHEATERRTKYSSHCCKAEGKYHEETLSLKKEGILFDFARVDKCSLSVTPEDSLDSLKSGKGDFTKRQLRALEERNSRLVWKDTIDAIWACDWDTADAAKAAVEHHQRRFFTGLQALSEEEKRRQLAPSFFFESERKHPGKKKKNGGDVYASCMEERYSTPERQEREHDNVQLSWELQENVTLRHLIHKRTGDH